MFLSPLVDLQSDVPLYRQLSESIRDSIHSGALTKGERLPPTRELAASLGLNRATVSAAYELLAAEGLIHSHVGRGSFVDGGTRVEPAGFDWGRLLDEFEGGEGSRTALLNESEDVISFASSRPSERLFPLEEFRASCDEVLRQAQANSILQLGSPEGYPPLRQYLLDQARASGIAGPEDDCIITNGCQQALDVIRRVLLRPGDSALIEDPAYPNLKYLFSTAGVRLVGVPVRTDGLDVEHLERVLARERPKLLVVTSDFQNPTGATLPLASRMAILRIARDAGVILVENDIYGDLRYQGASVPTMKKLDEAGNTILLRSFSKIAFPGLRVGWIVGPRVLLARLALAKQWSDLHTDQLSQAVLLRFAESGRLRNHQTRIVSAGAERLSAVLESCERYLPEGTSYTRPQGGMNLWVSLPEPLDAGELLARAQREKVTYLPGKYFAVSRHEPGGLRLSFAGLPPAKIRRGIKILGDVFSSEVERVRLLRRSGPAPAMV